MKRDYNVGGGRPGRIASNRRRCEGRLTRSAQFMAVYETQVVEATGASLRGFYVEA